VIGIVADRAERIATRNKDGRSLEHRHAAPKVSFGGRISSQRRFSFGPLLLDQVKGTSTQFPVRRSTTLWWPCAPARCGDE
jgi:hypothetical protein